MDYFNYENVAREAGISQHQLERIVTRTRKEFPHDDMMFELHVLRTCMAIRDGQATIDEVLAPPASLRP